MLRLGGVWGGGGVSQLKPALCAIGRYRGVSQLYCRKSRLDGPLRACNWVRTVCEWPNIDRLAKPGAWEHFVD